MPVAGPSKPLPSHRERQQNPRVQMMPMQVVDKSGTSFISTKQKIAERAGASKASPAALPAPAPSGATAPFPQKSKSLANLSFKKKTVSNLAHPPASSSSSVQKQASTPILPGQDMVRSPVSATTGWGDPSPWSPVSPMTSRPPPIPRPVATQPVKTPLIAAAEQFLNSVMPEE